MANLDVQYHVTLRSPMGIRRPTGEIMTVRSFDATLIGSVESTGWWTFQADRIWISRFKAEEGTKHVVFKGTLIVPKDNIAGVVQQPFIGRK